MRQTLLLDGPLKASPRPAPSSLAGSTQPAHPILQLQRTIGNRSVQQLFRKCACDGECPTCQQEQAEEQDAVPGTLRRQPEPAVPRGAAFPASCASTNCSAVGHRFEEQPPDLQKVLTASFKNPALWFQQLDSASRMALSGIFNRMCSFGVWCHVSQVLKIDPGEALVGDLLSVPGSTPSVHFLNPGGNALLDALMATGRFCQATGAGASQHPGQSTLREISGSDSLHISIGPGNQVDAHIDRNSPVTQSPGGSFCSNAPSADAVGHIGKELAPEKVRQGFSLFGRHIPGPAGFQVFPDDPATALTAVPQPDTGSPRLTPGGSLAGITLRGPVSKPPGQPRLDLPSPVLPAEVVARIDRAIQEQFSADALLPSHARQRVTTTRKAEEFAGPDEEAALLIARDAAEQEAANYPDPYSLARELAERLEQASRNHEVFVKIDLPQYDGRDFGSRRAIAQQIERMALILRHHLPSHAEGVHSVVMFFGGATSATREEAKLP